ncbi:MAG: serine/threonine-protein kinase [Oscillatoria sp. PMC 1068.18]|nr:serine/threonine-protein kinase [Oscillatoria sp. PMC 1076.18]MEC4989649.1 serine/threonine-protein kinase [Oscillatoria sp. PMC 1068.18]
MQPIPAGTVLQNHYRIKKVLGKGGFGRTYLAEDLTRFDETCVLKEYNPGKQEAYVLEKSQELFKREAQVLYKIDHPQIPKFRGTFTAARRLFLVQDFVEGTSYSDLLKRRRKEGQTFSQVEAFEFLQQMLPVLEHIHSKEIIHRDISPDNIILRKRDRLPILIDFGAVKENVAKIQAGEQLEGTTLGKIGYSPDEQLRTGKVFPNSDLYALAVTVVVLMTGREPQNLLDQNTMTWRWQQWIPTLNVHFGGILNRMLSARPQNRYQSATEVAQALRSIASLITTPTPPPEANVATTIHRKTKFSPQTTYQSPTQMGTSVRKNNNSLASKTKTLWAIGIGSILFVIVLFGVLVKTLIPTTEVTSSEETTVGENSPSETINRVPENSTSAPAKSPTNTSEPQTVTPSPEPTVTIKRLPSIRLRLQPGINKVAGSLDKNEARSYLLSLKEGQNLKVQSSGGAMMNVLAPNREPVNDRAEQVQQWQGILPTSGSYSLELMLPEGVDTSDYKLEMTLSED